jgi:hypothetical protein
MDVFIEKTKVPKKLETREFIILPLRPRHADLDYKAQSKSKEILERNEFSKELENVSTIEDNLEAVREKRAAHVAHEAFSYTVLRPDKSMCLGGVHIESLHLALKEANCHPNTLDMVQEDEAVITFWVRQSQIVSNLDQRLLQSLIVWMRKDWPISHFFFQTNRNNKRQVKLFLAAGMRVKFTFSEPDLKTNILLFG